MMTVRAAIAQSGSAHSVDGAIFAAPVLIVDDTAMNREVIAGYLKFAGFWNIEFANDGIEALERIDASNPDLVVLDIMMPRMDGIEVCRRLRAEAETEDLPILVLTALSDPADRAAIFLAGASDLISRPIDRVELVARVRLQLERRLMLGRLMRDQHRLRAELRAAASVQIGLMPSSAMQREIEGRRGLEFGSYVETSSELGGDFWGLTEIDEDRVGVYIVDFSGHGVTAALNTFRLHTLIHEFRDLGAEPTRFVTAINLSLNELLPPGSFATMLYGIIDVSRGSFSYIGAGSPAPILRNEPGGPARFAASSGVPLGITPSASYECLEVPFPPHAMVFLCSDGLIDIVNEAGIRADEEEVAAEVDKMRHEARPQRIVESVVKALGVRGAVPPADDVTVVCVCRR